MVLYVHFLKHAHALELLKDHLYEGAAALDVGSGSGYLTACMAHMVQVAKNNSISAWSSKQTSLHFTFIVPNPSHELPGYHPFTENVNQLVTCYMYTLRCNICIDLLGTTQHNQVHSSSLCSQSIK